ncbi:translation machinery-associated protein 16-like [Diadema antillarum]|uniref:translation machinery-associated protein 16-like n=1 Tax=Diadema antillarum TaxID=105358 RepID=UPI003A8B7FFA
MPKAGRTKVAAKCHKLIHPQSRKANKLGAREIHKERVKRVHQETSLKNSLLNDKLMWFKDALDADKQSYNKTEAEELVSRYLQRFDEELEQISIVNSFKSRSGRQHASREGIINATRQREEELFTTCGIEIPDIVDMRTLKLLRAWDGSAKLIANIKMRKIVRTFKSESNSSKTGSSHQPSNMNEIDVGERGEIEDQEENNDNDDDDDVDEGVEDGALASDVEEEIVDPQDSQEDEGVESH